MVFVQNGNLAYAICTAWIICAIYVNSADSKTGPSHDKVVVCYLATWAVYRPGRGSYEIENFDPNLCTHVIYAFSGLDTAKDAIKSLDPWQDLKDDYGKGGFERITNLKKTNPHLKVSLAIGGWNEGSSNYSIMAADPGRRSRFVRHATEFVRRYNFDGLDLDWEYPTQRGGKPADKQNFVQLVKDLRSELNKHGLLLTSAIGASSKVIDEAYSIRELSSYLDFLHIMCYDYGGSWDAKVGANAPLKGVDPLTVEYTINYLISLGASPSKIVLGLPFYGRTFVTSLDGKYGDEANKVGFQGPFTREDGYLGYNEMCVLLSNKSSGWEQTWDAHTAQAIAKYYNTTIQQRQVVVFDNARSIANKMRYATRLGLAGAMVWSVDTDDFMGDCPMELDTFADFTDSPGIALKIPKRINSNYPLLRTINEAIVLSEDELRQENILKELEKENEIIRLSEKSTAQSITFAGSRIVALAFIFLGLI